MFLVVISLVIDILGLQLESHKNNFNHIHNDEIEQVYAGNDVVAPFYNSDIDFTR